MRPFTENLSGAIVVPFPPRPRRLDVRISAFYGRAPLGRTRPIRLTERDFTRLLEAAERLEARR
jgi:hypothetical protein